MLWLFINREYISDNLELHVLADAYLVLRSLPKIEGVLIRKYKKKNIYIYIVDISVENYIENILSSPGLSVRAAVQQHKGERE